MQRMIGCLLLGLLIITSKANASISELKSHDGIAYILQNNSQQILRYSLENKAFLTPLSHQAEIQAINVDSSGLYFSSEMTIFKYSLDTLEKSSLRSLTYNARNIEIMNDLLVLATQSFVQSINKNTGQYLDESHLWYTSHEISSHANSNTLFTVSAGISPADVSMFSVNQNGQFTTQVESPYHGEYAIGNDTFPFPNGHLVVDSAGTVYRTDDLTFVANIGSYFSDIDFTNERPVVLRNDTLYGYNENHFETGSYALAAKSFSKLKVYQNHIFAFSDNDIETVQIVAISDLKPDLPVEPVDPTHLSYTPDHIALDENGDTLYLVSSEHQNVFRWSISQQAYLTSIGLAKSPQHVSYSAKQNRLYLAYDHLVTYLDLSTFTETPFATFGSGVAAFISADDFLVVRDHSGSWGTFTVFDKQGMVTHSNDWAYPTTEFAYHTDKQRVYYISGFSPSDLHWHNLNDAGELDAGTDSPYHASSGWSNPIRPSKMGNMVALGSGRVVFGKTMSEIAFLNNEPVYYKDIHWLVGNVFSIRSIDNNTNTHFQRYHADFSKDTNHTYELAGAPVALMPLPQRNQMLVITRLNGQPQFTLFTQSEIDFDNDGHLDSVDMFPADSNDWADFDEDDIGNNADLDDDNDGVDDINDAFPLDSTETLDTDNDGIGNNADLDDDNDNVNDANDAFPLDPAEQHDADYDGIGNNADTDDDNDGVLDENDAFPLDVSESLDSDNDGIGNNADTDDDNDGVNDSDDAYPLDASKSRINGRDFLPLQNGSSWRFDTGVTVNSDKTKKIGGVSATPLRFSSGSKFYLSSSDAHIKFHGLYLPAITVGSSNYKVDVALNSGFNLSESGNYSGQGEVDISPTYGKKQLSWQAQVAAKGITKIATPAGEFDAYKTTFDLTATTQVSGQSIVIYYTATLYFAEGIGLVRIDDANGQTSRLTSYALANSGSGDSSADNGSGSNSGGGSLPLFALLGLTCLLFRRRKPLN